MRDQFLGQGSNLQEAALGVYRGRQHRMHRDACGKVRAQRAVFIARRVYFALFFLTRD